MNEDKPIKPTRNKGGRPKLPEHELRRHKIEIWLSDVELADFEMMRQSTNLTRADLLRALLELIPSSKNLLILLQILMPQVRYSMILDAQ